jgi:uncharacterized metal-binding protein YceD (DUF177 family)
MGGRGGRAVQQPAVTSGGSDEGPLAWNVAGLLADDPGADRVFEVEGVTIDLGEDLRLARPIDGRIRLLRTNRGILAHADLRTALALECSRCLREIEFLETPVREAIQLAEPIAPLCRPDCPGLCIVCGLRLDDGVHDHPDDDIDPRMEALRGFRPDGA